MLPGCSRATSMLSPPLTPPSSDAVPSSSSDISLQRVSRATCRNTVRFLQQSGYSDDDESDNDDAELRDYIARGPVRNRDYHYVRAKTSPGSFRAKMSGKAVRASTTPTKSSQASPSRFIVRGNVTPSRAAPFFRLMTQSKRARARRDLCGNLESDSGTDGDSDDENCPLKSPSRPPKDQNASSSRIRAPFAIIDNGNICADTRESSALRQSQILYPTFREALPPPLAVPTATSFRPHQATSDVASLLHSIRSNSFARLPHATSSHGIMRHASNVGVLGASRSLGAGSWGLPGAMDTQRYLRALRNTSSAKVDLFTLPSSRPERTLAQPTCAEFANSARNLSSFDSRWLAVGNNEGRVSLINTGTSRAALQDEDKPVSLSVTGSSVLEVKWRYDDELLATASSSFVLDIVDTATLQTVRSLSGGRGSTRTMAWDPNGRGQILCSGGRDGAIHIYDLRMDVRREVEATRRALDTSAPVLSIWGAHAPVSVRSRGRVRRAEEGCVVRSVTSTAYVPGHGPNSLASAGCGDGVVKIWDTRALAQTCSVDLLPDTADKTRQGHRVTASGTATGRPSGRAIATSQFNCDAEIHAMPLDCSRDVTSDHSPNWSSHGISSLAISSSSIFAASTDGCIHTLPCRELLSSNATTSLGMQVPPLFDASQQGNSLFSRLALHDDERTLALGNAKGDITVWDTKNASLALAELQMLGHDTQTSTMSKGPFEELDRDICHLQKMATPIRLSGHERSFEINSVSWANGPSGSELASTSDDYTIRLWRRKSFPQLEDEEYEDDFE